MKKTQVALAALALVASTASLANVTVYGAVDAAVVNANNGNGTFFDGTGAWTAPTHLGFKGSEDLGNGMKATFQLETGVSLNNGAAVSGGSASPSSSTRTFGGLFTRVSTIGLSGDFGSLTLGQQLSPYIVTHVDCCCAVARHKHAVNEVLARTHASACTNNLSNDVRRKLLTEGQ